MAKKNRYKNKVDKIKRAVKLNSLEDLKIMSKKNRQNYYETINGDLNYSEENPVNFLKWGAKYKCLDGKKIKDMDNFSEVFPFASKDKNYEKLKNTELPLTWFKNKKGYEVKSSKEIPSSFKLDVNDSSTNINKKIKDCMSGFIPYTFISVFKINLISPYYSSDDDDFYLIDNPVLKEKVFKNPMIRGSGWKGAISSSFVELINEASGLSEKRNLIKSYLRIFGTGSEDFRKLEQGLKKYLKNQNKTLSVKEIASFLLFDLGIKLDKDLIEALNKDPMEAVEKVLWSEVKNNKNIPVYLQSHKGRAIFYPTYFDKLSLEIINPHDRQTRAGTNPIHYEVVPKYTKGLLQLVYIPHDGILTKAEDLKKEVEADLKNLRRAVQKVSENGVGAKTKLGWGQFKIIDECYSCNKPVSVGLKECEGE